MIAWRMEWNDNSIEAYDLQSSIMMISMQKLILQFTSLPPPLSLKNK